MRTRGDEIMATLFGDKISLVDQALRSAPGSMMPYLVQVAVVLMAAAAAVRSPKCSASSSIRLHTGCFGPDAELRCHRFGAALG